MIGRNKNKIGLQALIRIPVLMIVAENIIKIG